jgi:hypothetical protein
MILRERIMPELFRRIQSISVARLLAPTASGLPGRPSIECCLWDG